MRPERGLLRQSAREIAIEEISDAREDKNASAVQRTAATSGQNRQPTTIGTAATRP